MCAHVCVFACIFTHAEQMQPDIAGAQNEKQGVEAEWLEQKHRALHTELKSWAFI